MSTIKELSFAKTIMVDDFIIEIIPEKGIELNDQHIAECHAMIDQLQHPIGLLFNRAYGFSYTFNALQKLLSNGHIVCFALVAQSYYSFLISQNDLTMMQHFNKPAEVFQDRLVATIWLNLFGKKFHNNAMTNENERKTLIAQA